MQNIPLKIIVEKNVPYIGNAPQGIEMVRLAADEITPEAVKDADALIVRTRTQCDKSLLEGSRVSFIATATIGTDHIDMPWCEAAGIEVANAPGCNAPAVAQYVFSSLMRVINRPIKSYRLGIVGVGHVGGLVDRWARSLGMKTLLCDPFLEQADSSGCRQWYSLEQVAAEADIITFHTPLTTGGPHPTFHMASAAFFQQLGRAPVIINSARGAVVDTAAWIDALKAGICGPAIIDCWEGEPDISRSLLELAAIATPHIAGYSVEGKQRASQMSLDALSRHFGLNRMLITEGPACDPAVAITPREALDSFDPMPESALLKAYPERFEQLRNEYVLRHEPRTVFES